MEFFFERALGTMVCPCAAGIGVIPVPRTPVSLRTADGKSLPLSRNDIRHGRVKRVVVEEEDVAKRTVEQKKPVARVVYKRPMGGFLGDAMRRH